MHNRDKIFIQTVECINVHRMLLQFGVSCIFTVLVLYLHINDTYRADAMKFALNKVLHKFMNLRLYNLY